jgi:hypothetical protein
LALRLQFSIKSLTDWNRNPNFTDVMADNIPSMPSGAMPPKKETVRINLPPKPSAAPTIKMPTLPPGGAVGGAPVGVAAPAAGGHPATTVTAAPPSRATAAPMAAPKPGTSVHATAAPRAAATVSPADNFLVYGAALAALAAVGTTLYIVLGILGQ